MADPVLAGKVYLAFSIIAVLLCLPPLLVQVRSRNFPVIVLVTSILVLNLQNTANAIIWPSWQDNEWEGQGLCDVEVRLYVALPVAATGAVACIFRQLAGALRTDRVSTTPSRKGRILIWIFELTLCIVFPSIVAGTLYFTSPDRYDLLPVLGCQPAFLFDWYAIILQLIWQPISASLATMFCIITIIRLVQHRRNFSGLLASVGTNRSRHNRLFAIALVGLALALAASLYLVVQSVELQPWRFTISWDQRNSEDWGTQISRWRTAFTPGSGSAIQSWACMAVAWPVFALLGFGREAQQSYRTVFPCVARRGKTNDGATACIARPLGLNEGSDAANALQMSHPTQRLMDNVERELWLIDAENTAGGPHADLESREGCHQGGGGQ
jgi:pheromone a factor receptor